MEGVGAVPVQVWALCLPGADIPVTSTYVQSAG